MDIRRAPAFAVPFAIALVLIAGCAAPSEPAPAAVPASASPVPATNDQPLAESSPTPSPSPTPTPTSPLDGMPQPVAEPVLVVKLDNTRNALPHAGLDRADVVYLEEVEYGITRIAAVFASDVPERIGPVRSARITDLDLLEQYGSPAFSFSGVQRKMWPLIDASPLIDISPNKAASAYQRDSTRRAPYNYFLNGQQGLAAAPDASMEKDIGFIFDAAPPPDGRVGLSALVDWPASTAEFRYDQATRMYEISLNGEPAQIEGQDVSQRASTVVIQHVEQEPSAFFDKGGGNTPHAQTIGEGDAVVLRDGLRYQVRWSRPDAQSGTVFRQADGSNLAFKPGQLWIALVDRDRPATFFPEPPAVDTEQNTD